VQQFGRTSKFEPDGERFIMTDLSDRQHDAFDNPAKMACRAGNLRVLREAAYLLWEDGDRTRLRCDWCELMTRKRPGKEDAARFFPDREETKKGAESSFYPQTPRPS